MGNTTIITEIWYNDRLLQKYSHTLHCVIALSHYGHQRAVRGNASEGNRNEKCLAGLCETLSLPASAWMTRWMDSHIIPCNYKKICEYSNLGNVSVCVWFKKRFNSSNFLKSSRLCSLSAFFLMLANVTWTLLKRKTSCQ